MKRQKKHVSDQSFVLDLKLRYSDNIEKRLDKVFSAANELHNLLIENAQRDLEKMETSSEWNMLKVAKQQVLKDLKGLKGEQRKILSKILRSLEDGLEKLKKLWGFSENDFEKRIREIRNGCLRIKNLIGSSVAQGIADDVWQGFNDYFSGKAKKISFRGWSQCRSIEGKSNAANIKYQDGMLVLGKVQIKVVAPKTDYERKALTHKIKYCRVVRLPWKKGWIYKLQLVLDGIAPGKGVPLGEGPAGIDLGPSTVAVCSCNEDGSNVEVSLDVLAPDTKEIKEEIRQTQRKLERSRRASNPEFFDSEGQFVGIDEVEKSHPDLIRVVNGRKKPIWRFSNNGKKLQDRLRYLHAKAARIRRQGHFILANKLVQRASRFYIETQSIESWKRRAKKNPKKPNARRKRAGPSVNEGAPKTLVSILENKAKARGGTLEEINTYKAKPSQLIPTTGECIKCDLSARVKVIPTKANTDKAVVQRDCLSSFNIMNIDPDSLDHTDLVKCENTIDTFLISMDKAMEGLKDLSTRRKLPSAMGVRKYFELKASIALP